MRYKAAYHPSELLCPLRYEWVPFDIAKPLLDRKSYVVLSDFATQPHAGSSPPLPFISNGISSSLPSAALSEDYKDEIDVVADHEFPYEGEDDKSDLDDSDELLICEISSFDVSNILIDLNGSQLRFKDLQRLSGHIDRRFFHHLELQLKRYARVQYSNRPKWFAAQIQGSSAVVWTHR
ncbi:hypothetical protein HPP92_018033 [Vanilla planifolia]|uniref:Uncharacterized protein n=1 Tax=Vanilla planifolia TaxID=51239 RepID=A0A835Q821_VANPL|nr:hypothetical protein HPP92_018033 [Vanilla planifolia]